MVSNLTFLFENRRVLFCPKEQINDNRPLGPWDASEIELMYNKIKILGGRDYYGAGIVSK
jgi:hypothetical protein